MIELVKDQSLTGLPVGLFLLDVQAGACAFAGRRKPRFLPAGILLAGGGREAGLNCMYKEVDRMTERQKRFADEYLIDLNAEAAAIRAGYSPKYARGNAHKLVAIGCIKEYISARMAEKESQLIADQDEVLKYLTSVLRGESQSSIVVVESTGDYMTQAREMQKAPDEKERLKAAELLGKRYGLYTEKVQQDLDMEMHITVDYGDDR